jgi:acyl-CoA synthetase (NDP forming)/GNAT superfamily N-acetyltransferase
VPVQEVPPPPPAADDLTDPRLVLRDGSVASVRPSTGTDRDELRRFFHALTPEARRLRFMGAPDAPDRVIDGFCSSDPAQAYTLVAVRRMDGEDRIIAAASYLGTSTTNAEVAFAVADQFQGKGIATLLFERLAATASAAGFEMFFAETFLSNAAMLDVFRDSGFVVRSVTAFGSVHLELSVTPSAEAVRSAEARRRNATIASLRPIMAPKSVAVIGASASRPNIGNRILEALVAGGFTGTLHVVHPRAADIRGVAAVPSARQLPAGVDLAVVAVPAASVLGVIDDCAATGVKSVVVISAGFAEVGPAGRALQTALVSEVRNYGMRMVGPNCMGLLNLSPSVRLNASFSPVAPPFGGVAFSSQSGALGVAILALADERGVGLSAFVSIGNKGDVSSNDLLEYWESDPDTRVVLLYVESFGNPRRFARLARRIGRSKPIVALKAGRTAAGRVAAGSHTAALAARGEAVDGLFEQSGVVRAETVDEMFDIAACLDAQPLPGGQRVALLTNGGGPGILAADTCEGAGLTVATFAPETLAALSAFLPAAASVGNPVDMVASAGPDEYRQAVRTLLLAPEVDALVVIVTPVDRSQTASIWANIESGLREARAAGASAKPVVACVMASDRGSLHRSPGGETIPICAFPENAVRALGKMARYAAWRARPLGLLPAYDDLKTDDARAVCRAALASRGDGWLTTAEVQRVLAAFGVPLAPGAIAQSADEAAELAARIGYPVAAKLAARQVQHKTDAGLVRTSLADESALRAAVEDILTRGRAICGNDGIEGVLVQAMVNGGVETLVGVAHDPAFGPLVGFGLGGTSVELFGDVHFRITPLTDRDAEELVSEPRGAKLLHGYRGRPPADVGALRDLLLRISRLADDVREVSELDLNPVMALEEGKGCVVVDARIFVREKQPA